MAKLADVELSMKGESKSTPQQESSFTFPQTIQPDAPTVATQQYVIFRLVKKQRRLRIDGICDNVLNPKTKRKERIWLLRGADSIWQSELTELLKDKDYVNRNRLSLLFEDGVCRISVNDERMLEYAKFNLHNVGKNRNGSGKYDYYEYDPQEEQKMRLDREMKKIKLIQQISTMETLAAKKLALFLGVRPTDDFGMPKGDEGIRTELLLKANSQPEIVEQYLGHKQVEIAYMVRQAIIESKIDLTAQNGNALWAGGKGFICRIPSNKKAYEYLTELAMTNSEEGKAFKEQLESIIT